MGNQGYAGEAVEEVIAESDPPEELGSPSEVAAMVLDLYEKMAGKGDFDFDYAFSEDEVEDFPLFQLRQAAAWVLALKPTTEVQERILAELAEEWPALADLLAFPDDGLRLEALDVLLNLIKKIRGKLAEQTREFRNLIERSRSLRRSRPNDPAYVVRFRHRSTSSYRERKRLFVLDTMTGTACLRALQDPNVLADYPLSICA